MEFALHLIADLDEVWLPAAYDPSSMRKLETLLHCFPNINLTLLSSNPLSECLASLDRMSDVLPKHWVIQDGDVLYHRSGQGTWIEDSNYVEWLASTSKRSTKALQLNSTFEKCRLSSEKKKAAAISYLESQWNTPRPLVVVGNPLRDHLLLRLADLPILTRSPSRKLDVRGGYLLPPGSSLAKGIFDCVVALLPKSISREQGPDPRFCEEHLFEMVVKDQMSEIQSSLLPTLSSGRSL